MSRLDDERYRAFKRGIGHQCAAQSLVGAHDAAIAYVHECRAADEESGGSVDRDDAEELRREGHA